MLVKDESLLMEHARRGIIERKVSDVKGWIEEQLITAKYIGSDNDPTNAQRQIGRQMSSNELEGKLHRLVGPNILFVHNEKNRNMKAVYRRVPDGEKEYICSYHNGFMPEHSIMAQSEEEVPEDMARIDPDSSGHIKRTDLPKAEWDGKKWVFQGGGTPGLKKEKIVWHERSRGWRTVLLRLVAAKIITPVQAEATFGADNRPEWAGHIGKQKVTTPW